MLIPRIAAWIASVGMMILSTSAIFGQDYPNKPVRIVTSSAGGGTDAAARLVAQGISGPLGQQLIVENRPTGVIPGQIVSQAPPDGYTLLSTSGNHWLGPFFQDTPYDPLRDFTPIALMITTPMVLVVHPSLPAKSVKELIALAKARPGEINHTSSAEGSGSHIAGELFKAMAGIDMVRISYTSSSVEMSDLLSGRVQVSFVNVAQITPYIKSGRVRALAVGSAEPSTLLPDLPTVATSGVAGYESATVQAMFAPVNTPAAIINRLNREIVQFLKSAETKQQLSRNGQEAIGSSPEQLATAVKSEIARLGTVFKYPSTRSK